MTLVFGVIGVLQAAILSQTMGNFTLPAGLYDSLLLSGLALLSFIGQMTIILALKFEQAGPVALVRSCDVIFGFVLQFIFLGVVPDAYRYSYLPCLLTFKIVM
jgi:drug/metabolite transporter (DMT)-like permease